MSALVISDPQGDIPAIEIKAGTVLTIFRGVDCLYVSEEIQVAGKFLGKTREICTVPREVRITVVP